jgi:hypothetical protein
VTRSGRPHIDVRPHPSRTMLVALVLVLLSGVALLQGGLDVVHSQVGGTAVASPIAGAPPGVTAAAIVIVPVEQTSPTVATVPNIPSGDAVQVAVTVGTQQVAVTTYVPPNQPPVAITILGNANGTVSFAATGTPGSAFYIQVGNGQWVQVTIPAGCGAPGVPHPDGSCSVSANLPIPH